MKVIVKKVEYYKVLSKISILSIKIITVAHQYKEQMLKPAFLKQRNAWHICSRYRLENIS